MSVCGATKHSSKASNMAIRFLYTSLWQCKPWHLLTVWILPIEQMLTNEN